MNLIAYSLQTLSDAPNLTRVTDAALNLNIKGVKSFFYHIQRKGESEIYACYSNFASNEKQTKEGSFLNNK